MAILQNMKLDIVPGDVEILRILPPSRARMFRRGRLVTETIDGETRYSVFIGDNEAIRGMTKAFLTNLVSKGLLRQFHP